MVKSATGEVGRFYERLRSSALSLEERKSGRQARHPTQAQGRLDGSIVRQEVHNCVSVIWPPSFFRHLSGAVIDAHGQAVDQGIGGVGDDVVGGGDALQDFHGLAEVAPDPNGA